ncbi:MAG: hypothetical protein IJS78_04820 [Clostridia bacterium]|nr:hypothetical protein [Clostridia bacterium]
MKNPFEFLKGKKAAFIAAGAALGVFLILWRPGFSQSKAAEEPSAFYEVSFYTESLEKRIEELCRASEGIRDVSVLLTLESGSEYVYAANTVEKKDGEGEASGTREYLIVTDDSGSGPVRVTEIYPKVRGVAVVCTGGDRPDVKARITTLLSAALGVPSNRITVSS